MNRIDEPVSPMSPALAAGLARLREAAARIEPPANLEAALRPRVHASTRGPARVPAQSARGSSPARLDAPRSRSFERWSAWLAWPVTVTATAGLVSWAVYSNPAVPPTPVGVTARQETRLDSDLAATPFLALTSLDDIPSAGRNEVVAATLPRATLAEFGLPVSPLLAAEPIDAEFLVAPNGGVLAVRFVETGVR